MSRFKISAKAGIIVRESINQDGTITKPIGTGPFEFVEWKPGVHIKMKKNKNYWVKGIPMWMSDENPI